MADNVPDEAFAHAVNQMGVATLEQIDAAKAAQAEQARRGLLVSLADVLIERGVITPVLRENIQNKVRAQQQGALTQLGRYKLLRKLGEGGMGAVYLAEDTAMGRKVALKILLRKHASDPPFLARFRREAKATANLNHVNIVCAYGAGEEMGYHFIVMEYCEGEPLDKMLKRKRRLPWDMAVAIVMQVARGLDHAHQHNIIHRDIKPGNIFICKPLGMQEGVAPADPLAEGFVAKILDLGLSKNISGEETSFLTQTGVAVGTPHYISPEQAKGDKEIDGRTDIYSLGATFYHLVTGETPFHGSTSAVIMLKHLSEQLPNPRDLVPELPDGVAHVIMRMMAKESADRYRDCKELLDDLALVIDGKSPSSPAIDAERSTVALARAVGPPRLARNTTGTAGRSSDDPVLLGPKARGAGPLQPAGRARRARPVAQVPGPGASKKRLWLLGTAAAAVVLLAVVLAFVLLRDKGGGRTATPENKPGAGQPAPEPEKATEVKGTEGAAVAPPVPDKTKDDLPGMLRPAQDGVKQAKEAQNRAVREANAPKELVLDVGNNVKLELVLIPAGKFLMGSPETEKGRPNEGPQHEVTISKAFYMGKYEVTQEEYERVVGKNPSKFEGAKNPVEQVSWEEAQDFCRELAQKTGKAVRLPTEAEWEYACRAGTKTPFSSGDADSGLDRVAWQKGNSDQKTHPVGQKEPNVWGLYDMHGNVWEWCQDREGKYDAGAVVDPRGPAQGKEHVVRGGSWVNYPRVCRSAYRGKNNPDTRGNDGGFRLALDAKTREETEVPQASEKEAREAQDRTAREANVPKELALDVGNNVKLDLVLIPPGKFLMGSPEAEKDGTKDEGPQHEVTITKPFYMGKYEVTVAQFERFVVATKHQTEAEEEGRASVWNRGKWDMVQGANWRKPGFNQTGEHPVTEVSWNDAQAFCAWAGKQTGRKVRLPTEAEWEYACRAGTKTRSHAGDADDDLDGVAWYGRNSGLKTHPVGQKKPNGWGLYDVLGNVSEWCQDWHGQDYYKNSPEVDPTGPASGKEHVVRGGCWLRSCRSANRSRDDPDYRNNSIGFRLAMDVKTREETEVPQAAEKDAKEAQDRAAREANVPKELVLDVGNNVKLDLVLIPPGKFLMGSPETEKGRDPREGPQHDVTISKPFYMSKFAVTVAQFREFVSASGYKTDAEKVGWSRVPAKGGWDRVNGASWRAPGIEQADQFPVTQVSWNDAQAFVKWLSQKTKREARLATEAEREYACRAGTKTRFSAGDADRDLDGVAWHGFNSGAKNHPVGEKKPNAWGLHDMHGNVCEWCQDWYAEKYEAGAVVDPQGPAQGTKRVGRGGSWAYRPQDCRSAARGADEPSSTTNVVGFRVVAGTSRTP